MGQQAQEEPRLGLGNMRAPMTSARPLAGQVPPVRTVRQPISQPEPVRNIRKPIAPAEPEFVTQEEAAMEDVDEVIPTEMEEAIAPVKDIEEDIVEDIEKDTVEAIVEDTSEDTLEDTVEDIDAPATTMMRPAALLKPIRGTLQPLEEEEPVKTAPLTPVGHMLVPEKKRGPPPTVKTRASTATLRPVRGTLTPVSKTPVKQLEPETEVDED